MIGTLVGAGIGWAVGAAKGYTGGKLWRSISTGAAIGGMIGAVVGFVGSRVSAAKAKAVGVKAGSASTEASQTASTEAPAAEAAKQHVNAKGVAYPEVKDLRTGQNIPFPEGDLSRVPKSERVDWNNDLRGEYIKEWYKKGYATPEDGWSNYDIHHIKPREFGGTNDFSNLTPVLRETHQTQFNPFWNGY